jgi:hypothetical protein
VGAEVALLEGPGVVDVADLARRAVAAGADLLGVAGGDGTQALVAGIAAEHDLPFLVIGAGTRNHFAMDLGLDRDNPAACLDALTSDGVKQQATSLPCCGIGRAALIPVARSEQPIRLVPSTTYGVTVRFSNSTGSHARNT